MGFPLERLRQDAEGRNFPPCLFFRCPICPICPRSWRCSGRRGGSVSASPDARGALWILNNGDPLPRREAFGNVNNCQHLNRVTR